MPKLKNSQRTSTSKILVRNRFSHQHSKKSRTKSLSSIYPHLANILLVAFSRSHKSYNFRSFTFSVLFPLTRCATIVSGRTFSPRLILLNFSYGRTRKLISQNSLCLSWMFYRFAYPVRNFLQQIGCFSLRKISLETWGSDADTKKSNM